MKILFLSAANNVHTMSWANAMDNRGHSVTIASCQDHSPDDKVNYNENIKIVLLKCRSGLGYYLNAGQLKRIVKSEKFDVINVHYASGYGTLGRMARLKHALLNVWGSDVYVYPYQKSFNLRIIKKNLKFYTYVASTSYCMADQAKKFIDRKYFITPFGVDIDMFKPVQGVKGNDTCIIGTVKTLSPIYGISESIMAFHKVVQKLLSDGDNSLVDKLQYRIYGKGEQREELEKMIDKLNLSSKIKLCGYVPNNELPEVYSSFDIFVCCSLSESFGVAAVEAMACGVPVVVSDADGFKEVVKDGVTGLVVPKGNVDAIADAMLKMIFNDRERKSFGENGVKRVRELYDWNKNVDTMENIYKQINMEGLR